MFFTVLTLDDQPRQTLRGRKILNENAKHLMKRKTLNNGRKTLNEDAKTLNENTKL